MRNKKTFKISRFDNLKEIGDDNLDIKTKTYYNYHPSIILENSKGIKNATFPYNPNDLREKEIKLADANIQQIKGLAQFDFRSAGMTSESPTHRLLIYASDKKIYGYQMLDDVFNVSIMFSNLEFDTPPDVIQYNTGQVTNLLLACSNKMMLWTAGYYPMEVENAPIITSICRNDGYIFCSLKAESYRVWYTKEFELNGVGVIKVDSNYINMEDDLGNTKKVVTFDGDVYAIRDYGITRIRIIKKEIELKQCYKSNTKIFSNTVAICGNKMLFVTNNGLFSFNGSTVVKLDIPILNKFSISNKSAKASTLGDKYFLALKIDFKDEKNLFTEETCVNNALLIYNLTNESYEIIRGVDIADMLAVKTDAFEKMLFCFNTGPIDKIGEICDSSTFMDEPLPKHWESENLTQDYNTKMFTKLVVYSAENITFKLIFDDEELELLTSNNGVNEFNFKKLSKCLKLEISSENENAEVQSVSIEYYED